LLEKSLGEYDENISQLKNSFLDENKRNLIEAESKKDIKNFEFQ
jgi:hypothetical protein